MRVYVYPADLGGCGYYRLTWPAKELIKQGHDIRIVHPSQNKLTGHTTDEGELVGITAPKDADVMVFQRVASKKMINGIKILREQAGIAVVVDVDDDMSAIHPSNPVFGALTPGGQQPEYDWNAARQVTDAATLVTVSTDALIGRYAGHGRGMILRNCVPEIFMEIPRAAEDRTIGWGGSIHSHPDDPQVCGPAMARLTRLGYHFKIVGPQRGCRTAFQLDVEPPATGPVEIQNYPHALTTLQVGIAPLSDTRFNEAKSWLKMLEYAALGIPCIGSPRAEYRRIHSLGVGLLAKDPKQWFTHGKTLLTSESVRDELAEQGRAAVSQLTIEKNAWRWWEAWTRAYEIQHRGSGSHPLLRKSAVSSVSADPEK